MNKQKGWVPEFKISRAVPFVVALAFLLRAVFGFSQFSKPLETLDQDRYLPFAKSLWAGEGFTWNGRPTAYRPPLYPLILAPLVGVFGETGGFRISLVLMQASLGAATTWLVINIARKIATSSEMARMSGLLAGFLTAADPVLLSQASLPMTETLAAFLLAVSLFFVVKDLSIPAGISFGLSALCRPSLMACASLVVLGLICFSYSNLRQGIKTASIMVVSLLVVILPWGIRNYFAIGWPVFTTTHGGYTFALANNEIYYKEVLHGPPGAVWTGTRQQDWFDSIGPSVKGMTEHEMDQSLKARTWAFVRDHPRDFLLATFDRQLRFWSVSPSGQVYGRIIRYSSTAWTLPFWSLVFAGLLSKSCRTWPGAACVAVIAGLASVHLIYWTDIRMRAPIVPALAIVAGQSLTVLKIFGRLSHSAKNDVNNL